MPKSTETQIIDIIADQSGKDAGQITRATTTDELGLDSLGMVEIIFSLEESFDISIPFNANENGTAGIEMASVGDIIASVESLISTPPANQ